MTEPTMPLNRETLRQAAQAYLQGIFDDEPATDASEQEPEQSETTPGPGIGWCAPSP